MRSVRRRDSLGQSVTRALTLFPSRTFRRIHSAPCRVLPHVAPLTSCPLTSGGDSWPKAIRSVHELADARRDADKKVGRRLLHRDDLDHAFRCLSGPAWRSSSSFARPRQLVLSACPLSIAATASRPILASAAMSAEIGSATSRLGIPLAPAANRSWLSRHELKVALSAAAPERSPRTNRSASSSKRRATWSWSSGTVAGRAVAQVGDRVRSG